MRKSFLGAALAILTAGSSLADIDISNFELGASAQEFQEMLISEQAMFVQVNNDVIEARKLATPWEPSGTSDNPIYQEYTDIQPSTEITGYLCDGKIFKVDFTSNFERGFNKLMMARKSVFKYLDANSAVLTDIRLHQDEKVSDVTQTFKVDRDALAGQARGEETITFAFKENGGARFNWLTLRYVLENKWFCPN